MKKIALCYLTVLSSYVYAMEVPYQKTIEQVANSIRYRYYSSSLNNIRIFHSHDCSKLIFIEATGRVSVWNAITETPINRSVTTIRGPIDKCRVEPDSSFKYVWINGVSYPVVIKPQNKFVPKSQNKVVANPQTIQQPKKEPELDGNEQGLGIQKKQAVQKKILLQKLTKKRTRSAQEPSSQSESYGLAATSSNIVSEEKIESIESITKQNPLSILLESIQTRSLGEKTEEPNEQSGFLKNIVTPDRTVLLGVYPNKEYSLIALVEEAGRISVWNTTTQKLIHVFDETIQEPIQECRFGTYNGLLWINSKLYSFISHYFAEASVDTKEDQEEPPLKKQKLPTDPGEAVIPAIPYTVGIEKRSSNGVLIARVDTQGSLSVWNAATGEIINSCIVCDLQNVTDLGIDTSNGKIFVTTSTEEVTTCHSYDIINAKTFENIQNWLCS